MRSVAVLGLKMRIKHNQFFSDRYEYSNKRWVKFINWIIPNEIQTGNNLTSFPLATTFVIAHYEVLNLVVLCIPRKHGEEG
jgi:hypothetical protein